MTRKLPIISLLVLSLLACVAVPPARAANLHLVQEEEIYIALDKLNAMGLLPGFLANTRPYDMQAVRAAVRDMPWTGMSVPDAAAELGNWVAWYSEPLADVRAGISGAYSSERAVAWNNAGIPTPDGASAQLSAGGRYEPYPWLSADGRVLSQAGGDDGSLTRTDGYSVQVGHKYLSVQGGKITTWYGPGRRGDLIYTNNAEQYPGLRIHNPVPIPMPGFLSFLGHFQYDLFFARMDDDRPVPNTMLSGVRFALRPGRFLELGVSRAVHYGGDGYSDGLGAWWDAMTGKEEGENGSANTRNQLAGYDVTLTLPFRSFPMQLYLEMAGEDQTRGGGTNVLPQPKKWAMTGGVFLPALFGNPSLDLRVEYSDNRYNGDGLSWYTHPYSPHEYKGRILGHAMGTDARDFMLQGRWFLLPSTFLEFTVTNTNQISQETWVGVETTGYRLRFLGWLNSSLRAGTGFQVDSIRNADGLAGNRDTEYAVWLDLAWRFAGGYAYLSSKEKP